MVHKEIRTLWRQFLRRVHPDVLPPDMTTEKSINVEFVKYLNEYIQNTDIGILGDRVTLKYYIKTNDRLIPKSHTFIGSLDSAERLKCLKQLFGAFSTSDTSKSQVKDASKSSRTASVFSTLLEDHYKRNHN